MAIAVQFFATVRAVETWSFGTVLTALALLALIVGVSFLTIRVRARR